MKYRIETIQIPAHGGIAQPDSESRDLGSRRIVHVIEANGNLLKVLTEEDS